MNSFKNHFFLVSANCPGAISNSSYLGNFPENTIFIVSNVRKQNIQNVSKTDEVILTKVSFYATFKKQNLKKISTFQTHF